MAKTATAAPKAKPDTTNEDNGLVDEMLTREDIQRVKDLPEEFTKLHQSMAATQEALLEEIVKITEGMQKSAVATEATAKATKQVADELPAPESVTVGEEWTYYDADGNEITAAEYLRLQQEEEDGDTWTRWFFRGMRHTVAYAFPHTKKEAFHVAEGVGIGAYVANTTSMLNMIGGGSGL